MSLSGSFQCLLRRYGGDRAGVPFQTDLPGNVTGKTDRESAEGVSPGVIGKLPNGFDDADVAADEAMLIARFRNGVDFVSVPTFREACTGDDENVGFFCRGGFLDVEFDGFRFSIKMDASGEGDSVERYGLQGGFIAECPTLGPRDVFNGRPVFCDAEEVKHEALIPRAPAGWIVSRC